MKRAATCLILALFALDQAHGQPAMDTAGSLCFPPSERLGSRCVHVGVRPVAGHAGASAVCEADGRRLLSDASADDLGAIIERLYPAVLRAQAPFLTSAVRAGSVWKWRGGEAINIVPAGEGRCLGLSFSSPSSFSWVAVDCAAPVVALCESDLECIRTVDGAPVYDGETSRAANGIGCLPWNHPLLPRVDAAWNHNRCRLIKGQRLTGCFVALNRFELCSIPECPSLGRRLDAVDTSTCAKGDVACGDSAECIPQEFVCDYEKDCANGADEAECEDYLRNFELVGAFKIVDKISEIWTNIPNVQGCARRCTSSSLLCEAFSYSPRAAHCLLTDSSSISGSFLSPRSTSLFYRRQFSPKEIEVRLLPSPAHLLVASKGGVKWSSVCDDGFSREYASTICAIFGFGASLPSAPSASVDSPAWTLQCLRSEKCAAPTKNGCLQMRCSKCPEAVCDSDAACISRSLLCNGIRDCTDGSDERACDQLSWRLVGGSDETRGRLEVYFGGEWEAVCAQTIKAPMAGRLCEAMQMGEPAILLKPVPSGRKEGRLVSCRPTATTSSCRVTGVAACGLQAHLRCKPPVSNVTASSTASVDRCGVRSVPFNARDPSKQRFARVVGGFEALPGAFPWTAAIRLRIGKAHHCGATLIHPRFLLTAAHCFEDDRRPSSYEVIVGDWDNNVTEGTEQILKVSALHFYPLYEDLFAHDLALVEVSTPAKLGQYVVLACLPPRDFRYSTGRRCVVSGWGSMGLRYPTRLQAAAVPIIERASCIASSEIYKSLARSAFCAGYLEGGIDSCQGDSGGPLVCQEPDGIYYLAGVISWGDGCAQRNQPGIYTMVAPYLSWIEDVIEDKTAPDAQRRHRLQIISRTPS